MLTKQFKELLDAFYGSIERFACRYDGAILRYSFFGRRAVSFVRLAAFVAKLSSRNEFAVEIGRAISSRWKLPRYVVFEIPTGAPDLERARPKNVELAVGPEGIELVFRFGKYSWTATGRGAEKTGCIPLTLNAAKIARYKT